MNEFGFRLTGKVSLFQCWGKGMDVMPVWVYSYTLSVSVWGNDQNIPFSAFWAALCSLPCSRKIADPFLWVHFFSSLPQEANSLRSQLGDRLNVEVDAAPTVDLNRVLNETRAQYEALVETNRRDVEEWYIRQVSILAHGLSGPSAPWGPSGRV